MGSPAPQCSFEKRTAARAVSRSSGVYASVVWTVAFAPLAWRFSMLRAFQVPVGPRSHTGKLGCTATSARSTSETAIGPSTAPVAITLSRFDHAAWSKAASPDPLTPATMRRYLSGASLIQSCRSQVDWRNRVSRSPEARRLDCAQSRPPRARGLEVRLARAPGRPRRQFSKRGPRKWRITRRTSGRRAAAQGPSRAPIRAPFQK